MANFKVAAIVSALALLSACSKVTEDVSVIKAYLPKGEPKAAFGERLPGGGLALEWQQSDKLTVIGNTAELYTICDGFTAHEAEFAGKTVKGDSFTIICPGDVYQTEADVLSRSYAGQVQNGNASTSHLEWTAMLRNQGSFSHLDFSKASQNGILAVSVALPENSGEISYLTIGEDTEVFYSTNDPDGPRTAELRLDFENVTVSGEGSMLEAFLMTSMEDSILPAGSHVTITVGMKDGNTLRMKLLVPPGGLVLKGGKVNIIRIYQAMVGDLSSSLETFDFSDFIW